MIKTSKGKKNLPKNFIFSAFDSIEFYIILVPKWTRNTDREEGFSLCVLGVHLSRGIVVLGHRSWCSGSHERNVALARRRRATIFV